MVFHSVNVLASFKVGTLNLYHYQTRFDERLNHLQEEIKSKGVPDIVGFQEAALWAGDTTLFQEFVRLTLFKGIYEDTNNFGIMNDGIALVSKLPMSNLNSFKLPATKMFSRQSINVGVFSTSIGEIVVVNAHLSPFSEGAPRRIEQSRFILSVLKQYPDLPVIILGDLNDSYGSSSMQILRDAGFVDVLNGQQATYDPNNNPLVTDKRWGPERLDYILYKPTQLKVIKAELTHTTNWVSDHYGLQAEFTTVQ